MGAGPVSSTLCDLPERLLECSRNGIVFDLMDTTFFVSRESIVAGARRPGMALWRERLFAWMMKSSESAMEFFKLPTNRVIELGSQLRI